VDEFVRFRADVRQGIAQADEGKLIDDEKVREWLEQRERILNRICYRQITQLLADNCMSSGHLRRFVQSRIRDGVRRESTAAGLEYTSCK
jgi:hypothetical protein